MNRSANGFYNGVTIFFAVLSLIVILVVVLMITHVIPPPLQFRPAILPTPTTVTFPTETNTPIPSPTLTPTYTFTPTRTLTPSKTPTDTPLPATTTLTPSITLTPSFTTSPVPPSKTATATKVPTSTKTSVPSKTPVPTINPSLPTKTPTGFPFKVAPGSPGYTANLNASIGCAFQGVGGQVFDMNNQPLLNITVHVSSANGFNQTAVTGSNPQYGPAGWQIQTDVRPSASQFIVELRTQQGVPLSPQVQVGFPGTCDRNLAIINFFQTRPY